MGRLPRLPGVRAPLGACRHGDMGHAASAHTSRTATPAGIRSAGAWPGAAFQAAYPLVYPHETQLCHAVLLPGLRGLLILRVN
jgi:hypothetical protein